MMLKPTAPSDRLMFLPTMDRRYCREMRAYLVSQNEYDRLHGSPTGARLIAARDREACQPRTLFPSPTHRKSLWLRAFFMVRGARIELATPTVSM